MVIPKGEELLQVLSKYVDVKFNNNALKRLEILFGSHCTDQNIDEIRNILNQKGISNPVLNKSKIQIK